MGERTAGPQMWDDIERLAATESSAVAFVTVDFLPGDSRALNKVEDEVGDEGKGRRERACVSLTSFQRKHLKQTLWGDIFSENTYFCWTQCKNF